MMAKRSIPMFLVEKALRGLICGALLTSLGCCYHAQHFGKKRDIGIGENGCATCVACPSQCEQTSCCDSGCGPGGCTPTTLPVRTAEIIHSNSSLAAIPFKDRAKTLVGRFREKIDGPPTERVELVLHPDSFASNRAVAMPVGPPVPAGKVVSRSVTNTPAPLPVVTTTSAQNPPRVPAAVAAPLPEVPLPEVPLEIKVQD
jgi:hypothetical protein